jgi:hypothetical protein
MPFGTWIDLSVEDGKTPWYCGGSLVGDDGIEPPTFSV